MSAVSAYKGSNGLLASLSPADFSVVAPHLRSTELQSRRALYDPDVEIEQVFFVESGMVSLLCVYEDGAGIETVTVGREGMVGMPVFHHARRATEQAVVQLAGTAQMMSAGGLRDCLVESPQLRDVLHRLAACQYMYAAQSVACMARHQTAKRLARWLLHASEQTDSDKLALTQLFLSHMLGVRRSSVTVAAGQLRERGLISYTRNGIRIIDRDSLRDYSCECYEMVRRTYARVLHGAEELPSIGVSSSSGGFSTVGSPGYADDPRSTRNRSG